ncbi:MAG: PepSY domain-containing protein, partial [Pseudolabrys sp.]
MRIILALATVAAIGVAGAAYATDQNRDNAQGDAVTADQMKTKIDKIGYDVLHMKKDDMAYKAH